MVKASPTTIVLGHGSFDRYQVFIFGACWDWFTWDRHTAKIGVHGISLRSKLQWLRRRRQDWAKEYEIALAGCSGGSCHTVPLTEWKWLSLSLRLVTGCGLSLESLRLGKDIIYCWARHSKDLMWYLQNMRWAVAGERSGMCIHLYVCLQAHEILRKDSVSLQRAMSLFQESNTKGRYLTLVWKLSCDIILCHKVGTSLIWYSQGQTFGRNMYILHNW